MHDTSRSSDSRVSADALRRAHSAAYCDPDLQTEAEARARQALADLGERYAREKRRLKEKLRIAEADAEVIRDGLWYGTGRELVEAVTRVLAAAEIAVCDLDIELGGSRWADLLATWAGKLPDRSKVGHRQRRRVADR